MRLFVGRQGERCPQQPAQWFARSRVVRLQDGRIDGELSFSQWCSAADDADGRGRGTTAAAESQLGSASINGMANSSSSMLCHIGVLVYWC